MVIDTCMVQSIASLQIYDLVITYPGGPYLILYVSCPSFLFIVNQSNELSFVHHWLMLWWSQRPVKQVRGPGHNISCGAPALVLHENMRNTCLNYLQVRPR